MCGRYRSSTTSSSRARTIERYPHSHGLCVSVSASVSWCASVSVSVSVARLTIRTGARVVHAHRPMPPRHEAAHRRDMVSKGPSARPQTPTWPHVRLLGSGFCGHHRIERSHHSCMEPLVAICLCVFASCSNEVALLSCTYSPSLHVLDRGERGGEKEIYFHRIR